MPRFDNGRLPGSELVRLDTGGGQHTSTLPSGLRWYLFRRAVQQETGVTLYITGGPNAYRDYPNQEKTRRDACNAGNCAQAAYPGGSSHGGTWAHRRWTGGRTVDAMAFDIGNYWAVPWATFKRLAERYGFLVGAITKAEAGIEEPWHIIDLNPYTLVAENLRDGLVMVKGGDGIWRLEKPAAPTPEPPKRRKRNMVHAVWRDDAGSIGVQYAPRGRITLLEGNVGMALWQGIRAATGAEAAQISNGQMQSLLQWYGREPWASADVQNATGVAIIRDMNNPANVYTLIGGKLIKLVDTKTTLDQSIGRVPELSWPATEIANVLAKL